ncbi:AsmA-like C-terminal region-containing protein [Methylopila sp. 73B]|uniref:YhdP family protein n=1 Tax=Methylopila sp. 73B TaxID=1120792 RepID=UPI00036FA1E9|nr:AsmA-like C-terminal region-containing protein [Methylopila sp. 73B]
MRKLRRILGDLARLMTEMESPSRRARALALVAARRRRAGPLISPRRAVRLVAFGLLGVAAALSAIWLAILYLPLPASQVIPRVTAALESRLGPDYAVSIEDAELHRGADGVELRLVDLAIAKAAGGPTLVAAPKVELRLDGLALLRGDVRVRSVHATNPRIDAQFEQTMGAASKQTDLPDRILAGVADLDRLLGPGGAVGALEEVEVTGAALLVGRGGQSVMTQDNVALRLSRGEHGAIALTTSSARPEDRWTIAVTIAPDAATNERVIDLGLENVSLAPYSAPFAQKAGAPPATGRLSGHLSARIGPDGRLAAGDGRISARSLSIALPGASGGGARSIDVDDLKLDLAWDPAKRAVVIEPSRIVGRTGQMSFSGALTAPVAGQTVWLTHLDGRDVLLAGEQLGDTPLRLDQVVLEARFDTEAATLEVTRAQVLGPTAKAAATALIRFEGASPAVRLGLVSDPMPTSAILRLWPPFLGHDVRNWAVANIRSGQVDAFSLTLDIPAGVLAGMGPKDPLPPGSMAIDATFSDATLRGAPTLPWIEGAAGAIAATATDARVTVGKGFVPGSSGGLAIADVNFVTGGFGAPFPKATVAFKAQGALDPAIALLVSGAVGQNPLPPQLDPAKVSGKISADVSAAFELGHSNDKPGPPVAVKIAADITDVTIADLLAGRAFDKGAFKLVVDGANKTLAGKGRIAGAPATVGVVETPATANAPAKRQLTATLTADAADLTRLGFDVPGALKGALPLQISLALDEPHAPISLSADLTAVGIDGLLPGFRKPAGRPGKLALIVEKTPEKTVVRDFAIESGDRSVRGGIEFGPKGELLAATFPIYRPAPGDDARVEIDKLRSGSTKLVVQGAALDLKPLLDSFRGKTAAARGADKPGSGGIPKTLDVVAKLGTGLGYGGEAIAGLDLRLAMRDGRVTDADGSGRIGAGGIRLATADDGRLRLSGGDAGAFFRFADLYGRVDGGQFDLQASLAGGPGVLNVKDFLVRNETALDRVRQTTGADANAAAADARKGATRFERLRVAFVQGQGRIEVKDAVVYGPQLGATLEGVVDYAADSVSLVGTFVPAYSLNNLFSKVPIIGALLTGGKNGGLLGVTFQVTGKTGAPTVTINPMSAVAPGFLRKLFEFRQTAPDAATEGNAPAGAQ